MAKKNYSFRFQVEVMTDIQQIVDSDKTINRSSTNLIETLMIDFIAKHKKKAAKVA